jgi:integrase
MSKVLTTAAVEKLRPSGERRFIRDGGSRSLYLAIMPSGHKSWLMRFRRPDGSIGKVVLGPVDLSGRESREEPVVGMPLSLSAARQLAASIHRERSLGRDVISDIKAQRARQQVETEERGADTFGVLLREYITEYAMEKNRQWRAKAILLGLDYPSGEPVETKGGLAQRWADRPARDVDGHDIHAVVDEALRVGVPGVRPRNKGRSAARARNLHAALSPFFSWLLQHREVSSNPCGSAWKPKPAPSRDRVLSEDEIRWLWRACSAARPAYGGAIRLLLLTGCRLNEVCGMRRDELSDNTIWTIPGSRTKNRREHKVPLPRMAWEIIESVSRTDPCVFSSNGGTSGVRGWSNAKRRIDAAMMVEAGGETTQPWTVHDLRRTAVTGMGELGIRPDVIELCVNHVSGSRAGVAGVYNRSVMMAERRVALERWAAHVRGLVTNKKAKVISLREVTS